MSAYPPDPKRHLMVSHLVPFGARLETEVISCASANPEAKTKASTIYTLGQNGYNPRDATHKFICMRWSVLITGLISVVKLCWLPHRNNGIVLLDTIPGSFCTRPDGICALERFITSQVNASALANYQYAVRTFYISSQVRSWRTTHWRSALGIGLSMSWNLSKTVTSFLDAVGVLVTSSIFSNVRLWLACDE